MEKMMSSYEALFIVSVANGDEAAKTTVTKFVDMIAANGEIVETAEWGRRRLAYPIEDMNEGYYVFVTFSAPQAFVAELYRIFNITDGILRSIVVKADEKASMPARVQETVAEAVVEEAPAAEAVAEEAAE